MKTGKSKTRHIHFGRKKNSNRTDRSEKRGRFVKVFGKPLTSIDRMIMVADKHEKNWQASNVLTSIK